MYISFVLGLIANATQGKRIVKYGLKLFLRLILIMYFLLCNNNAKLKTEAENADSNITAVQTNNRYFAVGL